MPSSMCTQKVHPILMGTARARPVPWGQQRHYFPLFHFKQRQCFLSFMVTSKAIFPFWTTGTAKTKHSLFDWGAKCSILPIPWQCFFCFMEAAKDFFVLKGSKVRFPNSTGTAKTMLPLIWYCKSHAYLEASKCLLQQTIIRTIHAKQKSWKTRGKQLFG